jgi:nucleoside-diphosphate-sugar epimerase
VVFHRHDSTVQRILPAGKKNVTVANIYVDIANIMDYVRDVGYANIGGNEMIPSTEMIPNKEAGLQVIFGNGPVGSAAARLLLEKGLKVRVVSRTGSRPTGLFNGLTTDQERRLEFRAADARDAQAAMSAAGGASHIYQCINVPYQDWRKVLPGLQENLLSAALKTGAVFAVPENLYMYKRGVPVINEDTPEVPPTRKGLLRKQLHDRIVEAGTSEGLVWTSVRASDYYGPGAGMQSLFGTDLFLDPLFNGKQPRVIGRLDQPHSYTYVEDYARALVVAALDERAHGRAWIVPNDKTLTARQAAEVFFAAAGRKARLGSISRPMVAAVGIFNPLVREVTEMLYQKEGLYVVDGSRFASLFGFQPTPLEEGVRRTIAWYKAARPAREAAAA